MNSRIALAKAAVASGPHRYSSPAGHWITHDGGHVLLSGDQKSAESKPSEPPAAPSWFKNRKTPSKPGSLRSKMTIAQASNHLQEIGYKLGKGYTNLKTKVTSYDVTGPNGENSILSTDEIHDLIESRDSGKKSPENQPTQEKSSIADFHEATKKLNGAKYVMPPEFVAELHKQAQEFFAKAAGLIPTSASKIREFEARLKNGLANYSRRKPADSEPDKVHDFSCVAIDLPPELAEKVLALGRLIPDEDLADDGREEDPHVTVKFGLHTDDSNDVKEAIYGQRPFGIKFGLVSLFENEDADVVKIDIESEGLHELNRHLSERLENTDTHPSYKPHVTVAYLKPGRGGKFVGSEPLAGKSFDATEIQFSDKHRDVTELPFVSETKSDSDKYSRIAHARAMYSKDSGWITIGTREGEDGEKHGGTPVRVTGGKISAGPASLKGETMDEMHDKSRHHVRTAKAAHAAAEDKSGRDYSPTQARALGSDHRVAMHQAAKSAARGTGVASHDVMRLMPEAHQHLAAMHESREAAKTELRKNIGMNAGDLARHENQYKDHSTVKNWDTAARDIAERYPDLGFDPDDTDTPAKVWDMLREGKKKHLALHDQDVADIAAEWLRSTGRPRKPADREPGMDDDWSEPEQPRSEHSSGKRAKDVVPFSRIALARMDYSKRISAPGQIDVVSGEKRSEPLKQSRIEWDESKVKRNADGEFVSKESSPEESSTAVDPGKSAALARQETYLKGDRAEYTGNVVDGFHEVEMMEGIHKGEKKLTSRGPEGEQPFAERNKAEYQEMQDGFRRLAMAKAADKGSEPKREKPGIPGQQTSLFDEDDSGQKQLFDYVPPKKGDLKKKTESSPSTLESIEDEERKHQQENKPIAGQRDMFSRIASAKPGFSVVSRVRRP